MRDILFSKNIKRQKKIKNSCITFFIKNQKKPFLPLACCEIIIHNRFSQILGFASHVFVTLTIFKKGFNNPEN